MQLTKKLSHLFLFVDHRIFFQAFSIREIYMWLIFYLSGALDCFNRTLNIGIYISYDNGSILELCIHERFLVRKREKKSEMTVLKGLIFRGKSAEL